MLVRHRGDPDDGDALVKVVVCVDSALFLALFALAASQPSARAAHEAAQAAAR